MSPTETYVSGRGLPELFKAIFVRWKHLSLIFKQNKLIHENYLKKIGDK